MTVIKDSKLRVMSSLDLEQVLEWRNHPNIRRYMYRTHEITIDEHRKWFDLASKNRAITLLIYEQDEKMRGFVKITQATCAQVADWGFYLAPNSPKGTGRNLGTTALTYAFTQIGLHKVCGQAIAFNRRSIDFHKALGFAEEGRMQEQHFDGDKFHDVVCFGLLRDVWQSAEED